MVQPKSFIDDAPPPSPPSPPPPSNQTHTHAHHRAELLLFSSSAMSHARVVPAAVAMYTRNYLTVGDPYVYSSPSLFLYFFISIFQMCSWGLEHSTEAKCSRSSSSQANPSQAAPAFIIIQISLALDRSVGRSVGWDNTFWNYKQLLLLLLLLDVSYCALLVSWLPAHQ